MTTACQTCLTRPIGVVEVTVAASVETETQGTLQILEILGMLEVLEVEGILDILETKEVLEVHGLLDSHLTRHISISSSVGVSV